MEMYPSLVLSQIALEPLFVWLFWDHAPHDALLVWLLLCYGLHAYELVRWVKYKGMLETLEQCRSWHRHFTFASVVAGAMWGAAAVLFFPADIAYQSILICVLLGLSAGAVTMNPVHPPTLIGYLISMLLPLIARVGYEGDDVHYILVAMLVLFTGVISVAGRGLYKTFILSLTQRFEKNDLLQQLSEQKIEIEDAKMRLEIANLVLKNGSTKLETLVQERTAQLLHRAEEIESIKETTILALSSLAETRDNETGNHIRRTQNYMRSLGLRLRYHPRFKDFLTADNVELLYKLAPLHDIGKVGIPDHILLKPGKLTPEEFEVMKTHAALGGNAIAAAEDRVNAKSVFLRIARQIALGHHEKWDGSGYPFGLKGDDIPIPARLMAIADVYDALLSRRVYKAGMGHAEVAAIIVDGSGKHFDPDVVEAFVAIQDEFIEIAEKYSDVVGIDDTKQKAA
ncbi:MAG: HD domain-containing phosphohydrolase [Sideroxydans sp.]|jgi:response regulator RpfG family c-di-GMP phosphodiesterase